MEKYMLIKNIGEGTFGSVCRATNKETGEIVAIKKMKTKYNSVEECLNLVEIKSLQIMKHPNIVQLKEVITGNGDLYLVFENMDCNLYEFMKNTMFASPPDEATVRNWCFQVFQALVSMNRCGYFHCDLKPENLLVSSAKYGGLDVKLADFGCAREICSQAPFIHYISTLWYRAPEVMLRSPGYDSAIDMWAMGAIIAELFTLCPLFPGTCELDQMYKICKVLGSPNQESWAEGLHLAESINFRFPQCRGVGNLSALIPTASEDAISLITSLCSWDPRKRPTAAEALRHPFFKSCFYIPPSLRYSQGDNQDSLMSDVQRNTLDLEHHQQQVENKDYKAVRQPRYRPPQARNESPATLTHKMAQLNFNSEKLVMPRRQQEAAAAAAAMKARGGWQMQRKGPSVGISIC